MLIPDQRLIESYVERGVDRDDLSVLATVAKGVEQFRCLAQRRLFGEPMEYIVGSVPFLGRSFKVDKRVYVPNAETEQLVRYALDRIPEHAKVMDVGTGCGNIAISVSLERPDLSVAAVDVDSQALKVAEENAMTYGAKIALYESSYLDGVPDEARPDVVIADLPWGNESYVLHAEGMRKLSHMPHVALFHPKGIYAAQSELIESAQRRGWRPTIFFETGLPSEEEFRKILPIGLRAKRVTFGSYSITEVEWE